MALRNDLQDKYVKANGYDVRYIEKGNGRPLVCLHGLGASSSGDQWLVNIDALSEVAHVYALDLPGWGLSSLPAEGYSFEMLVETVEGFCAALGLQEVDITGQSLGGWIAALHAYYHPERVRRVILVGNAGLNPMPNFINRNFELMNREQLRNSLVREWTTFVPITDAQVDEQEQRMNRPGRQAAYRSLVEAVHDPDARIKYSLRDKLPSMQQPVLVVWGDDAPGIALQYGLEAFDLAPNGRLAIIFNGNHSPMGFAPREFEAQAKAFLTQDEVKGVVPGSR